MLSLRVSLTARTQERKEMLRYGLCVTSHLYAYVADRVIECNLTVHADHAHLVPDFCGMSMIVANEILETIQRTKNHNKSSSVSSGVSSVGSGMSGRTLRPGATRPGPQLMPSVQADSGFSAAPQKQPYDEFNYGQPPKHSSVEAVKAATASTDECFGGCP